MAAGWNYLQGLECQGSGKEQWPDRWEKRGNNKEGVGDSFQNVTTVCVKFFRLNATI